MTVGFLGDVHGDVVALRRAFSRLKSVDQVVCLGDYVGGASDSEVVALVRSSGVMALQGNHDQWAFELGRYHLDASEREWLGGLPRSQETPDFLAYHSEWFDSDWEALDGSVPVLRAFHNRPNRLIFCAHTHIPCVNKLTGDQLEYLGPDRLRAAPSVELDPGSRYLVNVGEVGTCAVTWRPDRVDFHFWERG